MPVGEDSFRLCGDWKNGARCRAWRILNRMPGVCVDRITCRAGHFSDPAPPACGCTMSVQNNCMALTWIDWACWQKPLNSAFDPIHLRRLDVPCFRRCVQKPNREGKACDSISPSTRKTQP